MRTNLDLHDAFYGGRTEVFKQLTQGVIKYIDVVSLYPTVQYYDEYPVGHYEVKTDFKPEYFGFVYCAILPPNDLYLPVLPYHVKAINSHKLVFGLCRTCMETLDNKCDHFKYKINNFKQEQIRKIKEMSCLKCAQYRGKHCSHNENERMIIGFWPTVEINKAIEKGYRIINVYQTWHFPLRSNSLFK